MFLKIDYYETNLLECSSPQRGIKKFQIQSPPFFCVSDAPTHVANEIHTCERI